MSDLTYRISWDAADSYAAPAGLLTTFTTANNGQTLARLAETARIGRVRDELDALIESLRGLHPLQISLSVDPVALSYLSSATTHDVLNIVREAISNTLRHSHAQTARVSLRHDRGSVWLSIEDDGIGFRVEEALMRGEGLHNIAMRARQLGARIDVRSSPGQGTTIAVEIPVRSHEAPDSALPDGSR